VPRIRRVGARVACHLAYRFRFAFEVQRGSRPSARHVQELLALVLGLRFGRRLETFTSVLMIFVSCGHDRTLDHPTPGRTLPVVVKCGS
jgi:hypothetical protein